MVHPWSITHGNPYPHGATVTPEGCNFAVHSPNAQEVELCLFDAETQELVQVISMPAKTGKVWHCHVVGVAAGDLYGYRVKGHCQPELGFCFDPDKLLIDPYAKRLSHSLMWDRKRYENDNEAMMSKCVVTDHQFDWLGTEKPFTALKDTVIYEAHVKGLTERFPEVPEKHRGKFLGICDPAVIAHLKQLGVTAIQLLPVAASMSEPYIAEKGLSNYWGYNPLNFFAPDPRFAVNDPVCEFKTMVRSLHAEGIEVILDVVFNHTAEGNQDGPMLSFKGFDNSAFYLFEHNDYGGNNYNYYSNNSGCGNSVNTAHHYPLRMVLDALRYWYQEMGVDGFRFDLAASLGREPHEFSNNSGFFRALRQDPVLQPAKLIAEPWDVGVGGYRLGQFPSNWLECNDKYRDNVRAFWRGDKGITAEFATRLLGSRDVFRKNHRCPHTSVNYITYHDGFTLQDVVSYNERHNEANREQNRDGHGHNVSANYGIEGETDNRNIILKRERQKRNMIATLFLSQGVPHFLGGDELSRTQLGNNNAYCQDNEISWFDWILDERKRDFLDFCTRMIALRKGSHLLNNLNLEDDNYYNHYNISSVGWYRPDGQCKVVDDWHDYDNQAFAVEFKGEGELQEHWFILFNASDHDVKFNLPELDKQHQWRLEMDTRYQKSQDIPNIAIAKEFIQAYKSIGIFLKCQA
ncbi:glycogen debranching protein GlgX [Paraneptunicella aestuarii]|uniref:glycogen debranching protein GlgX n=1 Tax=Paraneptunicella aestuarii TaxID=2831148 RepID=UPI001E50792C|nr:glycogen debranching protein GlgX [Paraneptunicella aestuarii]UAA40428.1 glycogen debranching protein GlgX [Paraneptunicella aestuarii]